MGVTRRQFLMAAAVSAVLPPAFAQAYPERGVRWVVPYPAGGGTDAIARLLAEAMRPGLGQTLTVENKPGAATNLAADLVARAKPDGYKILSADNALLAFNEHLFRKLAFSPDRDFTYIGAIGRFPLALVVHPDFPAKSVQEFLDIVIRRVGEYPYASPGMGSPHHLAMELLQARTRTSLRHVPYKGAALAMQDVMAGHVPVMFLDLPAGLAAMQAGKVRPLAIGSRRRAPALPTVPTLGEAGVADVEVFAFQGIVGPAGLPPAIVSRLNAELNRALVSPAVAKRFAEFGIEAMPGSAAQFYTTARAEAYRWGEVIRRAGIEMQ